MGYMDEKNEMLKKKVMKGMVVRDKRRIDTRIIKLYLEIFCHFMYCILLVWLAWALIVNRITINFVF